MRSFVAFAAWAAAGLGRCPRSARPLWPPVVELACVLVRNREVDPVIRSWDRHSWRPPCVLWDPAPFEVTNGQIRKLALGGPEERSVLVIVLLHGWPRRKACYSARVTAPTHPC